MENLIVSLKVVTPLMIYMLLGALFRRQGVFSEQLTKELNGALGKAFIPFLMFRNIYQADLSGLNGSFGLYAAIANIAGWALFFLLFSLTMDDPARVGSMTQCAFRSNAVIYGLPVAESLFGVGNTLEVALTVALCVPIYNVFSVLVLEICGQKAKQLRGEGSGNSRIDVKSILLNIAQNRLIWAAILGFAVNFSGIDLPDPVDTVIAGMASTVTPVAFLLLGASFSLNAASRNVRAIGVATLFKLVLYPMAFLVLPILWGWRGRVIGAMLLASGAPTAISSFPMAESLGCDGELAGEIVAVTSVLSVLTMFLWIFGLKQFGLM